MPGLRKPGDIRVGVIGYGTTFNMACSHLDQMKLAGMTPVAVVEQDPKRLEAAANDFVDIETYPSVSAMLKRSSVNLVTVITPPTTRTRRWLCGVCGPGSMSSAKNRLPSPRPSATG